MAIKTNKGNFLNISFPMLCIVALSTFYPMDKPFFQVIFIILVISAGYRGIRLYKAKTPIDINEGWIRINGVFKHTTLKQEAIQSFSVEKDLLSRAFDFYAVKILMQDGKAHTIYTLEFDTKALEDVL